MITAARSAGLAAALALSILSMTPPAAAQSTQSAKSPSLPLALGKRDFETYCAACHGESGKGDGPVAEFIALTAPDLTRLARKNAGRFPAELVERIIDGRADVKVHGTRDMPIWGDWFDVEADQPGLRREEREIVVRERIATLTAYLKSIQE